MPTLLFWRFTAGLYYAIYTHAGFANAYGNAFQNYVGAILQRGTALTWTKVFPEEEYHVGRYLKRTVDWIVEEQDAVLFIEAKTKRMLMEAKVEIISLDALSAELEKMASMIVQMYKSIRDYREDLYPTCKFNPSSRIFPILVTLEDWFIFGPKLSAELQGKIREGFVENKLPVMWLDEMPYTICSIQELEQAIQIMRIRGIGTVMASKVDAEHRTWALDVHLRTKFKEDIKDIRCLFQDEYDQLVPDLIDGGVSS